MHWTGNSNNTRSSANADGNCSLLPSACAAATVSPFVALSKSKQLHQHIIFSPFSFSVDSAFLFHRACLWFTLFLSPGETYELRVTDGNQSDLEDLKNVSLPGPRFWKEMLIELYEDGHDRDTWTQGKRRERERERSFLSLGLFLVRCFLYFPLYFSLSLQFVSFHFYFFFIQWQLERLFRCLFLHKRAVTFNWNIKWPLENPLEHFLFLSVFVCVYVYIYFRFCLRVALEQVRGRSRTQAALNFAEKRKKGRAKEKRTGDNKSCEWDEWEREKKKRRKKEWQSCQGHHN